MPEALPCPCHCAPGHMSWAEAEKLEPQSLFQGLPSAPSSTLVAWHIQASAMRVCPGPVPVGLHKTGVFNLLAL